MSTNDDNRTFSRNQKRALLLLANNKCEKCGVLITMSSSHADHVIPWSLGGKTTIKNGQALCVSCNLKKGNKMLPKIKDKYGNEATPRKWQKEAFQVLTNIIDEERVSALLNVCPGGGKTILGQLLAKHMLAQQMIEKVIIISPRAKIRSQWERGMTGNGIPTAENLTGKKANNRKDNLPDRGLSISYHLLSSPTVIDYIEGVCLRYRTLVIMDEIHWTGRLGEDGGTEWGRNLVHATRAATFCLALSGTPFREDHYKIPFLTYEDGRGQADYNYDYGTALLDGVVTPLYFDDFGGSITFHDSADTASEPETLDYADGVYLTPTGEPDNGLMNKRLSMSLLPSSGYWRTIMKAAMKKLDWIRTNIQPNAGGIVFAVNQKHARAISSYIAETSGVNPAVIISSEDTDIDSFATSNEAWVVSVKMISEGVDIERLRVAALLTNVTTRKNFMQSVARIIRLDVEHNGPDANKQEGYVFMPQDPRFIEYALEFKHAVTDLEKEEPLRIDSPPPPPQKNYEVDTSESEEGGLVFGEEYWTREELDETAKIIERVFNQDDLSKIMARDTPEQLHVMVDLIMKDQRKHGDSGL